ncbi:MAG: hypothetical protein NZ826_06790, partial [Thermodesulfovibrio sp.]|nr:hypothetical protein [Thermodesulfovibrio sp.]
MVVTDLKDKIRRVFPKEQANVVEEVLSLFYENVKINDFNELKAIVKELAIAQKELAEAQKRTEKKVEELA